MPKEPEELEPTLAEELKASILETTGAKTVSFMRDPDCPPHLLVRDDDYE